jgi:hypothetical protein
MDIQKAHPDKDLPIAVSMEPVFMTELIFHGKNLKGGFMFSKCVCGTLLTLTIGWSVAVADDGALKPVLSWPDKQNSSNAIKGIYVGEENENSDKTQFNGIDNNVIFKNQQALQLGKDNLTIEIWMKTESPKNQRIVAIGGCNNASPGYQVFMTGGIGKGVLSCNNKRIIPEASFLNCADGVFHHIALSICRQNFMKLFIDGKLRSCRNISAFKDIDIRSTDILYIGSQGINAFFDGSIDHVDIYKQALSDAVINKNYKNKATYYKTLDLSSIIRSLKKRCGNDLTSEERAELEKIENDLLLLQSGDKTGDFSAMQSSLKQIKDNAENRHWNKKYTDAISLIKDKDGNSFAIIPEGPMKKISSEKVSYAPSFNSRAISAAGNEYESFQLVFVPITGNSFKFKINNSKLVSDDGKSAISADNIEIYKVEMLKCKPHIYPDPLIALGKNDLYESDGKSIQPFWVTVYVPANTPKGIYHGTITFDGTVKTEIPYSIKVRNFTLPVKPALQTAIGLSPEFIAAWTPDATPEKMEILKDKYVRCLLKHRLSPKTYRRFSLELGGNAKKVIAQNGCNAPSQEEVIQMNKYFLHPRYILTKDGNIKIDFSEFDRQIEKYLPLGLNSFIAGERYWDANLIANYKKIAGKIGDTKFRLLVFDETSGKEKILYLPLLSKEYFKAIEEVFSQWQQHVKEKGWQDMAYLYNIDEPAPDPDIIKLANTINGAIKKAAPDIPLLLTMPTRDYNGIGIYCMMFDRINYLELAQAILSGKKFWSNLTCSPHSPYANFFLYQPGIFHRMFFWQTFKYQGTGFLYWEANYWYFDPNAGLHGKPFPLNLDGSLLYPGKEGPVNSVRLENIRDGVEDYDYLALLRKAVEDKKVPKEYRIKARTLIGVSNHLTASPGEFTHNPDILEKYRDEIAEILDNIND